jgi:hypothetical protein
MPFAGPISFSRGVWKLLCIESALLVKKRVVVVSDGPGVAVVCDERVSSHSFSSLLIRAQGGS